ncbi:UNVERIFIED_CONTAM: DeSI-like protein [Sesamum angustifolium]|uniref:DeSI-like protein n=1 Tax=Sesamum angustifolium TaxID=2727405 RepID=A0AAW2QAK9_9LAMI
MRLFPVSSSSDSSPTGQSSSGRSRALVYLNVYDLTHINSYLYWFGCGIFHSGIEAHGLEYGFGAHEYPSSGVFEVEPRSCPGFIFRRSILLGSTELSRSEFRSFMEYLSNKYHGDTYNLISKNCNHFTDEVSMRLTGKPIPGWVNRLARLEDGTDSGVSSATEESEEEDLSHHLFSTPDGDVEFLQDRPDLFASRFCTVILSLASAFLYLKNGGNATILFLLNLDLV